MSFRNDNGIFDYNNDGKYGIYFNNNVDSEGNVYMDNVSAEKVYKLAPIGTPVIIQK